MPAIRDVVLFPVTVIRQVGQIASGLWSFVRTVRLETFIPEWLLRLTIYAIPKAIAGKTPEDQIEGSIILIGWSIATSLFTGFLTIGFVLFWGIFLGIGIVRFSDWGSAAWDRKPSISLPGKGSDGRYKTRRR
ncbi:hypothetical protein [Halosolutus gelatinilyticus]|uniref:hypothetical protein n=1 Tax=Halosolutus gelatinilyticus TaxID=2931975 RepID=UPI001FF2BED0|nr:hypothetical protein [Halosolutus gelatinilyticus]